MRGAFYLETEGAGGVSEEGRLGGGGTVAGSVGGGEGKLSFGGAEIPTKFSSFFGVFPMFAKV